MAAMALITNVALVGALFLLAGPIFSKMGQTGTKMVSKISSLLLAAFAIMLVRKGIIDIWVSLRN